MGKQYRVPQFLSTSERRSVTEEFMGRQPEDPVLWTIEFDPRGCNHVNFIAVNDGTLGDGTHADRPAEHEFLFAPYSAFTVENVTWRDPATVQEPHEVTLRAYLDNRDAPDDLPLAPWA